MAVDDVAAVAADDVFDVTAHLAAAFNAAEAAETRRRMYPPRKPLKEKADRVRDEKGWFAKAERHRAACRSRRGVLDYGQLAPLMLAGSSLMRAGT
jgi:hypothetical protein